MLLTTPAYADLDKAVELAEQGKVKEGQLELIKIVRAADSGDPKSQLEFGLMWDRGYWLWQDDDRAVKWWRKSAEQGYTQAQLLLGTVYLGGVKADKDLEEAEKWFNKAIESDETLVGLVNSLKELAAEKAKNKELSVNVIVDNRIELSLAQARSGNFEEAKEIIEASAVGGNAKAQYLLSKYYQDPNGLNQPEVGKEWLLKSAKSGHPEAQYYYALDLSAGWKDTPIEKVNKAIYWFEKSGSNDVITAYADLSVLYENDERDVLREIEALANKGDAMAQYNIGWINGRGLLTEDGLKQDEDMAKSWFKKSAKQGFEDAVDILKKNF
ncbi:SEL1-like repeat protein [Candidatus Woesearchaeota archaeon]|nr:SEL1-like repeat protein [Candidatus Woesearchaeota archaeon]